MNRAQEAAQELLIRRAARQSIYPYLDLMRETGLPDFIFEPQRHHRLMVDTIHNMRDAKLDRATFAFPPGAAKSTYASVIAPTFLLAADPTAQIICVSNSQSLAESFSRRRRAAMLSPQWQRISGTELLSDAKSLEFQGTQEGGGIRCLGAGSTVTGFRADWIFADDLIVGHEQASSLAQLDKIWAWFLSELRSRLKPQGKQLVIGTRWAAQDPIGRLYELYDQEVEDWRHIRVPMICDRKNDPLGRELGDRLWPEWFTEKMVKDAQRDPQVWSCLYQQTPMDFEGAWVGAENFIVEPVLPVGMRYYIGVDLALSVQKGDYTAFAVVGIDNEKRLHVVDVVKQQVAPDESVKTLMGLVERFKPLGVFIDNDGPAKVWSQLVWQASRNRGNAVPVQLVPMQNKDKEARATPLRAFLMQRAISFQRANWNTEVFDELIKFPGGRHDDVVDALGLICRQFHKLAAPRTPAHQLQKINRVMVPHREGFAINASMDEMFDARERKVWNKERI